MDLSEDCLNKKFISSQRVFLQVNSNSMSLMNNSIKFEASREDYGGMEDKEMGQIMQTLDKQISLIPASEADDKVNCKLVQEG